MLNRRHFLSGASASAIAAIIPVAANSLPKDVPAGRTVINAMTGYANLAKGVTFSSDPTNSDHNGYPSRTPSSAWVANPSMPVGYFGDYVWKSAAEDRCSPPPVQLSAAEARTLPG